MAEPKSTQTTNDVAAPVKRRKPYQFQVGNKAAVRTDTAKKWANEGMAVAEMIEKAAPSIAAYLIDVGRAACKPHWARIDACKYILDWYRKHLQSQGLLDEAGRRIVSYRALILLAEKSIASQPREEVKALADQAEMDMVTEADEAGLVAEDALCDTAPAREVEE